MREQKFIEWFNTKTGMKLIKTEFKFERFDFYDEFYIVELKIRDKVYPDKAIQVDKCFNLIQTAEVLDKIPLYIVADKSGVFVYNLNNIQFLEKMIVEMLSPATTEFTKNKMITKYFYLLQNKDASKVLDIN